MPFREGISVQDELKKWLVRRVECIRGKVDLGKYILSVADSITVFEDEDLVDECSTENAGLTVSTRR